MYHTYITEIRNNELDKGQAPFTRRNILDRPKYGITMTQNVILDYAPTGSAHLDRFYSIELMRIEMRKRIGKFEIQGNIEEIDFLVQHPEMVDTIGAIKTSIEREFGPESKVRLELKREYSIWETLFIIASIPDITWEKGNDFVNRVFRTLYKNQPTIADTLNIIISPDGL